MANPRLGNIVFPVVITALLAYFTYHIFQGQRGVIAWIRLDKKLKEQEAILDTLAKEKEALEKEAYLLRPDSLDLDLLAERARHLLNFAHPDELSVSSRPAPQTNPRISPPSGKIDATDNDKAHA